MIKEHKALIIVNKIKYTNVDFGIRVRCLVGWRFANNLRSIFVMKILYRANREVLFMNSNS